MLLESILGILLVALVLYNLLGGADYGAGILCLLPWGDQRSKLKPLIAKAIGPVWEANHIWLILIIVILFVGFPRVYTDVLTYLHWPVVLCLIGIIFRGCSFVFMHYDPIKDHSQIWYERIFAISSLWTSFFLGVILAGVSSGELIESGGSYEVYVSPWLRPFNFFFGCFLASIYAALASIYLLGETKEAQLLKSIKKRSYWVCTSMIALGFCVFLSSLWTKARLAEVFISNPYSVTCFIIATALIYPLWQSLASIQRFRSRGIVIVMVALVIIAWCLANYPAAIKFKDYNLSFYQAKASVQTLYYLLSSLLIGLCIITPSLVCLFLVFKKESNQSVK